MALRVPNYKDINIDFFSKLKKPLAERFKPGYAVTTLVIIALAALVYFSYDFYQKEAAKVDSLDIEYANNIFLLNKAQTENTNGLMAGWRLKNIMQILAGMTKCLGQDKSKTWDDVLKPAKGTLTSEQLNLIEPVKLAQIAQSGYIQYAPKLMRFYK